MPHIIKKKDYQDLEQAIKYIERAMHLLSHAQHSNGVIGMVGLIKDATNDLFGMHKQLSNDFKEFTTK